LNLHQSCNFELLGPGVTASPKVERTKTIWFEGPLLPLPDSQRQEDYPKDLAGQVRIAADAPLGLRYARLWNSQGVTPALKFMVGDLPEVVEQEIDGDPVPVAVTLPLTVNGRIFPREDVDLWAFAARRGQVITCEVAAARIGSPLDARIEVVDPQGRLLAENDDGLSADPRLRFTAPADGQYQVRIHDINFLGGQAFVYRLTLTTGPWIEAVFPLGGQRGSTGRFQLTGANLPAESVAIALPKDGPADYRHELKSGERFSNPFLLDLDDLPEHQGTVADSRPITGPAILNSRIEKAGQVDSWPIQLRKGEAMQFELRAGRLGSPLTGVLAILDAAGKELARAVPATGQIDPVLTFQPPADGVYRVQVADQFRSRGGETFAYRLRVAPPTPDFRLQMPADALTVNRGGQVTLKVNAERLGGFQEAIALTVEGLPEGVTVAGTQVAAKQATANLVFKAEATAKIQTARLILRGTAKLGEQTLIRAAMVPVERGAPPLDQLLLAVAVPTPFKVVGEFVMSWAPRGSVYHRRFKIERNGFEGPLEIRMADKQARHLQGVTGPVLTVPAGKDEFDYPVFLPPWIEMGRTSRSCVMATGVVRAADGSEHVVCFTSVNQNEQIVVIPGPARLALEVDRLSLAAVPGEAAAVAVGVIRDRGLQGPVKLEIIVPEHLKGLAAEPVTIPADGNRGNLTIRFAKNLAGPFNQPLLLRATLTDKGEPIVAEIKLEVQPAP
jgi:hypothetical protein